MNVLKEETAGKLKPSNLHGCRGMGDIVVSVRIESFPNLSLLRTPETPLTAASVSLSHRRPARWEWTCAAAGDVCQATCSYPRCHGVRVRGHGRLIMRSLPGPHPCPLEPLPVLT